MQFLAEQQQQQQQQQQLGKLSDLLRYFQEPLAAALDDERDAEARAIAAEALADLYRVCCVGGKVSE